MRTLDKALDRIEKFTEDAFGWLEINVRRLGRRLTRRPSTQPRSVASGDRGQVEAAGRRGREP